jgi:hypothetical protein
MATQSTPQVTTASIDRLGISVATSSRNVRSSRAGTIYDQSAVAAGQPVWFHPMPGGGHLALFSCRRTAATLGGTAANGTVLQSSATTDTAPCWSIFDPRSGRRGPVLTVPSLKPGTRTLTAAASRGDFLFTLNLYRAAGSTAVNALLQGFRATAHDGLVLEDEEFIPGNLGLGLYVDRSHLWVFGDDGKGELALARKNWGRVGNNSDRDAANGWQYRGLGGWHTDLKRMTAIPGPDDKGLPAAGPCSVGVIRDRFYLSATRKVARVAAVPGTPTGGTTGAAAQSALTSVIDQLAATLNGIINGVLQVGPSLVSIVTDLLARASEAVTGLTGNRGSQVTVLVQRLLGAITGTVQEVEDPASLIERALGAITGIPVVGNLVTAAGDFLEKLVVSALGLASTIVGPGPVDLITGIIESLTGIDLTAGTPPTGTTGAKPAVPASWHSTMYTSRRVDETWSAVTGAGDAPLGDEDTYLGGGAYLQPQLPLSRGFDNTVTTNGVTTLNEDSHHVQVFSGSATQTVVLPATAKVAGTTIEPDGSVTVPTSLLPRLSIADARVAEGGAGTASIRFTVTSTFPSDTPVTVQYQTVSGTATPGQDYVTATGTLTIPGGTVSQQIAITVNGDTTVESDEAFTITLSNPSGATIGTATATGTIVNDDSASALDGLLETLKNIVNGIITGTIQVGSSVVSIVSTILEQSARIITGTVGDVGSATLGLIDEFLSFVSGDTVELPGDYATPGEALASIVDRITGGVGAVTESVVNFGQTLYTAVTTVGTTITTAATNAFRGIVNGVTGIFSFQMQASALMLLSESSTPGGSNRVTYMSYTIHNQSTADVTVMASGRDRPTTVPRGVGVVFTPYTATPIVMSDWSWAAATDRAPRAKVGFARVSTVGVGTRAQKHTLFMVRGTGARGFQQILGTEAIETAGHYENGVGRRLDPDVWDTVDVAYPGDQMTVNSFLRMDQTSAQGVNNLKALIEQLPPGRKFAITGASQGAMVISRVYEEIRGGTLAARDADLLAAVAFGNPRRYPGWSIPGGTAPGGVNSRGAYGDDIMDEPDSRWWDFVNTGDIVADCRFNTDTGRAQERLCEFVQQDYSGVVDFIQEIIGQFSGGRFAGLSLALQDVTDLATVLFEALLMAAAVPLAQDPALNDSPHVQYHWPYTNLPGNTTASAVDLAVNYLTGVGEGTPLSPIPAESSAAPSVDFTFRTEWSVFDPTEASPPALTAPTTPAVPATPPGSAAKDPDRLKSLIGQLTAIVNQVVSGALSVGFGVIDTVNGILLDAIAALTGETTTDLDGRIRALTTGFLRELGGTGVTATTASSLENLIRQITGGTGLTGGMVQGTTVGTPLEFIEQVVDAAGDVVEDVVEGLSDLFAQIVNAITGK